MVEINKKHEVIASLIDMIGDDATREGLRDTPRRVVKAFEKVFEGYRVGVAMTTFENESHIDQIVGLSDIEYYSTCEHHLMPFFGHGSIYYIPNEKIIGISKLGRVLDKYARRLQNQERLTKMVADELEQVLKPKALAVVLEGKHFCMMSRGVAKQSSSMKTSDLRGVFREKDNQARQELFQLI